MKALFIIVGFLSFFQSNAQSVVKISAFVLEIYKDTTLCSKIPLYIGTNADTTCFGTSQVFCIVNCKKYPKEYEIYTSKVYGNDESGQPYIIITNKYPKGHFTISIMNVNKKFPQYFISSQNNCPVKLIKNEDSPSGSK